MSYLKIKDNVDLKELEKFGFEYKERKEYNRIYQMIIGESGYKNWFFTTITVNCYSRFIETEMRCLAYSNKANQEIITSIDLPVLFYDLIQAGLVEKVVE